MSRWVADAAHLMRETCHTSSIAHVQDVYAELADLVQLLRSTVTAVEQVKRSLDELPVFDDRPGIDPDDSVVEAMDCLARACRRLAGAESSVNAAWQVVSHLGQTGEVAA